MICKWLSASEISALTSSDKRVINRRAVKDHWVSRNQKVRGGMCRIFQIAALPEDIQTAYAASIKITLTELQRQLKPAPAHEKKVNIPRYNGRGAKTNTVKTMAATGDSDLKIASLRVQLINAFNASGLSVPDFITAYENGVAVPELRERLGKYGNIHTQSNFYGWLARYERHGIVGLAPQYAKRRGGSGASLDEQAKGIIQAIYLDPRKPSIRTVERDIKQFGYEINYSVITRYIKNEIPLSIKTFYRDGEKAYHDKFDPYIERDYTLFNAMEWGCADHHVFDFVINHNGRICRPWLTMFIDMRSRKITGWHIDIIPSTLTILRALSMSVDTCGLFTNLLIDNGKDFKSTWFAGSAWKERKTAPDKETRDLIEGVLQDCGMKAHFCKPYRGQSKPIERAFRTIIELFSKENSFYVGSNTTDRPVDTKLYWGKINGREKIDVTQTLEDVRESFSIFVAWFNSAWKHTGQGMNGKTPDAVFTETVTEKREIPQELRKYIFARREKRTVQRNGVTLDGIEYYAPEMVRYIGSEVEVRRDIDRLGAVSVFRLPERTFLFDAQSDVFKDKGLAEENLRIQKREQKAARQHLHNYARHSAAIRDAVKSPAELLAEKAMARAKPGIPDVIEDTREVAGGEPLAAINTRRLRLPTDPD